MATVPKKSKKKKSKKQEKANQKTTDTGRISKRNGNHSKSSTRNNSKRTSKSAARPRRSKMVLQEFAHNAQVTREAEEAADRARLLLQEEAGSLEAEGPFGRTYKFSQRDISRNVDLNTKANIFDLVLPELGPYKLKYTNDGRNMLIAGRKGHLAIVDALTYKLRTEVHVKQVVRDACFLQSSSLFAVAQKRNVYIYDDSGAEVHNLRKHIHPIALDYLPYHFLLTSVGEAGWIKYQDVSTGDLVAQHRTKLGRPNDMRQNPHNGVMCVAHGNGCVTMWNPNMSTYLAKMLCHRGPVQALAVDTEGRHMVTTGADGRMKVWDIRMFKRLHTYSTQRPGTSVDISQRGMIAVASGPHIHVWKDCLKLAVGQELSEAELNLGASRVALADTPAGRGGVIKQMSPYLKHCLPQAQALGQSTLGANGHATHAMSVRFRPFEDVCGIGHTRGVTSIVVPGSGEPNFDAFEANPYASTKQKRESQVQKLLEKLPPSSIVLRPEEIGTVARTSRDVQMRQHKLAMQANAKKGAKKPKKKMRGKNKANKRFKKKRDNIHTRQRQAFMDAQHSKEKAARKRSAAQAGVTEAWTPLKRFA